MQVPGCIDTEMGGPFDLLSKSLMNKLLGVLLLNIKTKKNKPGEGLFSVSYNMW